MNRRLRNKVSLTLTAVVLCLLGVPTSAAAQSRLDLGALAPALSGSSLEGASVSLESYRGRWVYVDFWASWCEPCMKEVPAVIELQEQYGGQGKLEVLSISLDSAQTLEQLKFAIDKHRVNYPVLFDAESGNRHVAMDWGVSTIPATFLLNPQGVIAARDITPHDIPSFVQFDRTAAPYVPLQLKSTERLLRSSPSSGWNTMRDLHINLAMAPGTPPVSHYQLFVTAACQSGAGVAQYYDVRYDLHVRRGAGDADQWHVEISKTSGESYVNRGAGAGEMGDQPLPEMTVAIDLDSLAYEFIVPVPACAKDLGYAIALFDERLGRYVRNGLNRVETGFDIGGY